MLQNSIGAVGPHHNIRRTLPDPLINFDSLSGSELDTLIASFLSSVGLSPRDADKLTGQMSSGQLQCVCISRSFAPNPALIVLDKAVSNLDLALQAHILDLLDGLRTRPKAAYLFITHRLRLARRFCDRIVVLHDGLLVDQIRTNSDELFTHPAALALESCILTAYPLTRLTV